MLSMEDSYDSLETPEIAVLHLLARLLKKMAAKPNWKLVLSLMSVLGDGACLPTWANKGGVFLSQTPLGSDGQSTIATAGWLC